jgi:[glutamine synthetase] adenylyltransferase / [glutamine synthetase]-adenylyl-L-tyrosine phosphorylase
VAEDESALREFVARMGADYAARHSQREIELHHALAAEVSPSRPARVKIREVRGGRLEVIVVGLDFFAEFALVCGLLAAAGLDIESGHVDTSAAAPRHEVLWRGRRLPRAASAPGTPPSGRLIVDEFRVAPRDAGRPEPERLERELERDLGELLGLVAEGRADEARARLDRRLAERFSRGEPAARALEPLEIGFDNRHDKHFTRMEVRGADTPGFLYALATALAMRGVYVQRVEIASVGPEARDRFLIASRDGRKIEDESQLGTLRAAVALLKQFTHLLPFAPDPAAALRAFSQLVDRVLASPSPGEALPLLASPEGLRELARLLGASPFLWEDFLRREAEHLLPVLESWRTRALRGRDELERDLGGRLAQAAGFDEKRRLLNAFKDEEMLLADMRHLLDPRVDIVAFSAAITDLAEAVVECALAACLEEVARRHGAPQDERADASPVAALGLGKFGGREMGYASDIELVFVYGPGRTPITGVDAGVFFEEVVREIIGFIAAREEGIFHVDLRLRPHGAKGPLATPLALLREYYRPGGGAAPFERQALVKLRAVAGDASLGAEAERVRDAFVWSGEPWDRDDALHLRERQWRELVPPGRFNVKYSPGALVEVEYAVQYLQLEHGKDDATLRTPSTLVALDRLRDLGRLGVAQADELRAAYLFWRRVADALRMVRGNAKDLLLPDAGSEEVRFLARRLGYAGPDWAAAAAALLADVARHREAVAGFFKARFRS